MDSLIFQAMAIELSSRLANSRIDKVVQVSSGTLVLKLWTGRENLQLLLKAEGQGAFLLSRKTFPAPAAPPRFCQLLRARLRRLRAVWSEPLDRVAHFSCDGPHGESYDLVFEAFGPRGNLILVDAKGVIVDLLWRDDGKRTLLPGRPYRLPDHGERISLFDEPQRVAAVLEPFVEQGRLTRAPVAPMSPALAQAILCEARCGHTLEDILQLVAQRFDDAFQPCRVVWGDQCAALPFLPAMSGFEDVIAVPDLSELVEAELDRLDDQGGVDLAEQFSKVIVRQRKRLEKRLQQIAAEAAKSADLDRFRICGELLLANLYRVSRGEKRVEVENYYLSPPEKMTIDLDPQLTPAENAEHYFKLHRKARRATEHHQRRQQQTEQEMAWLEEVSLSLDEATDGEDLYQVQLELEGAGLLKQTKGQLGRRRPAKPEDRLCQAVSPAGWPLFWGKNSQTNDYVSCRLTTANDLWFHAHNLPGAHLVLKCGDRVDQVDEADILHAAALAAGYSHGKGAGKVEVIVASGRHVRKPRGARLGLVTVESFRTVRVEPRRLPSKS